MTIWLIVFAGLALRSFHFFRNPILWHDEAALVVNVITKDYAELLGPLQWHEAAPPLFLWVERAVACTLGDDLQLLRLLPLLASCASLLLMIPICRRCLPAASIPWALFLFAVSETLLWHSCEAKQYALEVFAATLLLFIFLTHRDPTHRSREIVLYALLAPILIFLCYPACFLYGGILTALLIKLRRDTRRRPRVLYVALGLVVVTSFALLALGPARAQRDGAMESCWVGHFPEWDKPWSVPLWMVANTGEVVRYCLKPIGQALTILAAFGAVLLRRRNERELLCVLLVPFGLVLLASMIGAYPYGASRVIVFLAPAVVLLIAAAAPPTLRWCRRRHPVLGLAALLLLLSPAYSAARRTIEPWPRADARASADYLRAQRKSDETIVAVSEAWAYHYYLRDLGPRFRGDYRGLEDAKESVAWAVYLEAIPAEQRLAKLRSHVRHNWRVESFRHFEQVTVVKLRRLSAANGEDRK